MNKTNRCYFTIKEMFFSKLLIQSCHTKERLYSMHTGLRSTHARVGVFWEENTDQNK